MTAAIGLLGGTFDPVHFAHLRLAQEALEQLPLRSVVWIPSGRPGHRGAPLAGAEDRLAMLRIALGGNPRFELDEADARTEDPVYSIDSLARVRARAGPSAPLVLIIGADQMIALDTWREWRRLFDLAHIAVAERPGFDIGATALAPVLASETARRYAQADALARSPAGAITSFRMTPLDISASAIRAAFASGRSARYLLPDAVVDYIASHHLYTTEKSAA